MSICPVPCVLHQYTSPLAPLLYNVKLCTSRLCMEIMSFQFVQAWAVYLSCGVPFPVWTPDNISINIKQGSTEKNIIFKILAGCFFVLKF